MPLIDREAFAEFYLLEDIVKANEFFLEQEKNKQFVTLSDKFSRRDRIDKILAVIEVFKSVIEIARIHIYNENYKKVWSSINERALMNAAKNPKRIAELYDLGLELLKNLKEE